MRIRPLATLSTRAAVRFEGWRTRRERERNAQRSIAPPDTAAAATGPGIVTTRIHPLAGLGHQVTGWISGWLWSRELGLPFAGGEVTRDDRGLFEFGPLVEVTPGTPRMRMPAVTDERNHGSLPLLRDAVDRALERAEGPVELRLPLDTFRYRLDGAAEVLRDAVLSGSSGGRLRALEAGSPFAAVHIRRPAWAREPVSRATPERWLEEEWYLSIIRALRDVDGLRDLEFRAYSVGDASEFPGLAAEGVELHVGGDRDADFVELAGARVLVVAPSAFSFLAGLVSRGHVIQPVPWWHPTPEFDRWLGVDRGAPGDRTELARTLRVWHSRR
jgi:hypothetical protein